MATKRAMQHLQGLVELDERADVQISALVSTLKQIIAQMDAILEDVDQSISEVLAEQTTGMETSFTLRQDPVKVGSVSLKLSGTAVAKAGYTVAGNVITPVVAIPAGKILTAGYVVLGLKAQTAELLAELDDLKASLFLKKRTKYQNIIQWIEGNGSF